MTLTRRTASRTRTYRHAWWGVPVCMRTPPGVSRARSTGWLSGVRDCRSV